MYTLDDYEKKYNYQVTHPNWLDEPPSPGSAVRVHRYQAISEPQLNMEVHSPVDIVLTDPNGNRLGLDPASGAFNEIGGGLYWEDETFYALDEGVSPEPAWENAADSIKRLFVPAPLDGMYSLQVIGTGTGAFEINVGGDGNFAVSAAQFSGMITPGETLDFNFSGQTGLPVIGDYNGDQRVDGSDLTEWQNLFGQSDSGLNADGDDDGDVDGADFLLWQNNFGEGVTSLTEDVTPVPEPNSLLVMAISFTMLWSRSFGSCYRSGFYGTQATTW